MSATSVLVIAGVIAIWAFIAIVAIGACKESARADRDIERTRNR